MEKMTKGTNRAKRKGETERRLVGICQVDSGQLMIVDPCYLSEWQSGEFGEENDYNECCEVVLKSQAGEVFENQAVVSQTGIGDGEYPVYVSYREGIPVKMEVCFDEGPSGHFLMARIVDRKLRRVRDRS